MQGCSFPGSAIALHCVWGGWGGVSCEEAYSLGRALLGEAHSLGEEGHGTVGGSLQPGRALTAMSVPTGPTPQVAKGTHVLVPVGAAGTQGWQAEEVDSTGTTLTVRITSAPTAPIGCYRLGVKTRSPAGEYAAPFDPRHQVYLLFNPWCSSEYAVRGQRHCWGGSSQPWAGYRWGMLSALVGAVLRKAHSPGAAGCGEGHSLGGAQLGTLAAQAGHC